MDSGSNLESGARSRLHAEGWRIVLGLSVTELVSWGVLFYAFGVLLRSMEVELGATRAMLTGAFSLSLLVGGLAGPLFGRWIDRGGARLLMTAGSATGALLVLCWGRVQDISELYLVWAGLGLVQAAVLYEPAFAVVAKWLPHDRARGLLVLTTFGGLASIVFAPLTAWLLARHGWRDALPVLAAVLACITIPIHGVLLRPGPRQRGSGTEASRRPRGSVRDVLRSPAFWVLAVALAVSSLMTAAVAIHAVPYLVESGFSTGSAATALGLTGAMQVPGRMLFTWLQGRTRIRSQNALVFLLQGISLVGLLAPGAPGALPFFVVLFGLANGMATLVRASVVADWYGNDNYGSIGGVLSTANMTARAVAPFAAGALYTASGSYVPVFLTLCVLGSLAAWLATAAESLREKADSSGPAKASDASGRERHERTPTERSRIPDEECSGKAAAAASPDCRGRA